MADLVVAETEPIATPEAEVPVDLTDAELLDLIIFQTLADGLTAPSPKAMARRLARPHDYHRIRDILKHPEFPMKLYRVRRDLAAYTTDKIKEMLPRLAQEMLKLALDSRDSRTQFAALKDLLDRGGTGAAQKVSLSTPTAYQQAIADLIEPVAPTTGQAPTP